MKYFCEFMNSGVCSGTGLQKWLIYWKQELHPWSGSWWICFCSATKNSPIVKCSIESCRPKAVNVGMARLLRDQIMLVSFICYNFVERLASYNSQLSGYNYVEAAILESQQFLHSDTDILLPALSVIAWNARCWHELLLHCWSFKCKL